jgi:hypothetical protein
VRVSASRFITSVDPTDAVNDSGNEDAKRVLVDMRPIGFRRALYKGFQEFARLHLYLTTLQA